MEHLYESIAADVMGQISRGIYRPGDRLPGVREISSRRRVSVATAIAAYRRLEDGGYIEARPRSGFYVRVRRAAVEAPGLSSPNARPAPVTGQAMVLELLRAASDPGILQLGAAVPDASFLPARMLEGALVEAARRHRVRGTHYAFPPGTPELRRQIARRMAESGASVHPDEIVITNGCQEALTLALRAVTSQGDIVAIESPIYHGLLQAIESHGLKALEIPTDAREGISIEALRLALDQWPVKACILIPNFSNPLGYCMPAEHRRRLVELLGGRGIPIIEDDVYGDLGFEPPRPPILKALERDGEVLHCSSFSKSLSPGLRVGWIAPGRYLRQVEYQKFVTSLATPTVAQLAVADILEGGRYERHLRQARKDLARAVDRMIHAVTRHFPAQTRITQPAGGFVIWIELPEEIDTFALARRALAEGIGIAPGPIFSATQKYRNFMRLSCACPWDGRVERALAVLARML